MAEKEYIERGAAKKVLADDYAYAAAKLLDTVPAADVQEVRHGKWKHINEDLDWIDGKCSVCGYTDMFANDTECFYNFCPECGAKMDKELYKIKRIIDVCCGGRMFWFDRNNPDVIFMDNRNFIDTLCDGRTFKVNPDVVADFRNIPYPDKSFRLVVFDPPHLIKVGEKSWLAKKYGRLNPDTYKNDLKQGFSECFRILKPDGVLVFKWNETDIKTSEIIRLSPIPPLFGHKSGKLNKTHWLVFMKRSEQE